MFLACKSTRKDCFPDARISYNNFIFTGNKKELKKSYNQLAEAIFNEIENIDGLDFQLVANVYMSSKKNIELKDYCKKLLENNLSKDLEYKVRLTCNLNDFKISGEKKLISDCYKILDSSKQSGEKNEQTIIVDYFTVMLFEKKNKEFVLSQIDSMQKVNTKFSKDYYKYHLKEFIRQYPVEYYK